MAEQLDLTTPVVVTETTDTYEVVFLLMNSEMIGPSEVPIPPALPVTPPPGMVTIGVKDNLGLVKNYNYVGVLAQDMIKFINTGDFSTRSLQKRILEKLSANGELVGAVVGTPDVPSSTTGLE